MMEQGENGLIHTKPTIPEKPKTIPPPTKVSNPLVSSIAAAVKKGDLHTPRVVFKDDKNLSRQLSPTWASKEADTPKHNLKDKNLPLVLPVPPKKAEAQEPESSPLSPVSASLIKVSTPKMFMFNPIKSNKDECGKTELVKEAGTAKKSMKDRNLPMVLPVAPKKADTPEAEPSPLTPKSVSPVKVSTPKGFVFTPQKTSTEDNDKADTVKEADTAKKSIKDGNPPMVLPVGLKIPNTPEAEPSPLTPKSVSPANMSTPKSFVFTPQKTSTDENDKADTVKEVDTAKTSLKANNLPLVLPVTPIKADAPVPEPSSLTPVSVLPVKMSIPKNLFTTPKTSNNEKEKTNTVDSPIPASHTTAPSHSTPAGPSVAVNPPAESVPVIPKTVVPSQTSAGSSPVPNILAPSIPASKIQTSASPEPKIPEPTIPKPSSPAQAVARSETSEQEISVSSLSDTEPLKPNINLLNLAEVFPPPEGSPPPDFTDIPPPVFEDFPDGDFSEQDFSPAILTHVTPVSISHDIFRLASPIPSIPARVSTESLVTPDPDLGTVSSPAPVVHRVPTPVDKVLENAKYLTDKTDINLESTKENQTSPKPPSALTALARAEEMASVKRAPQDSRIFNILERSKRKSHIPPITTPLEDTTPDETDTPQIQLPEALTPLPETATTDVIQPDLAPPEKDLPQLATIVAAQPKEAPPVPEVFKIPELPPVDYVDQGQVQSDTYLPETAKVNGIDHRVLTVVKPVHPPPPPPRKVLPATPVVNPILEKPTQSPPRDLHTPTTPSEHSQTHEYSVRDSSFGDVFYEDVTQPEAPAVSTFRPPSVPSADSGFRRPISVHEEAFLKHLTPKHQDLSANLEEMDHGSVNSASLNPESPAAVLQDSPALSPSGTLERGDSVTEQSESKKGKTVKNKKQKGPPKNPYVDTPAVVPETPKKSLFSRKNSAKVTEDKEQKKKEKQREKEKEKEKEREKKEQKEKEKKENEMRKKFKITGQEEPMYHVKVIEDCKGRKNDLPVKVGDTVSIIRIVNCPKGKWLAKDSNNKYGYVPVESMDLNINGIRELGKMTTASNRSNGNGHKDTEIHSTGSRTSEHYDVNNESFSEDSDEWTCDEDDPVFGSAHETAHIEPEQSHTTPDEDPVQENPRNSLYENVKPKQEAVQRLSTFLMQPKMPSQQTDSSNISRMPESKPAHEENPANLNKEDDLEGSDVQILPPPDLYADIIDSMPIYSKPIKLVSK